MNLGRLLDTVIGSSPGNWHLVTAGSAVYIPDVSITMSWSETSLEIRFHNAVAYRLPCELLNGMYIPVPSRMKDGTLEVTKQACALMKIVDSLGRPPRPGFSSYESDLSRAGFTIIDTDTPNC